MAPRCQALRKEGVLRESGEERYAVAENVPLPSSSQMAVLQVLSSTEPMSVREIATAVGKTVDALSHPLRVLVRDGWVTATAPTTSRARKYLRAADPSGS